MSENKRSLSVPSSPKKSFSKIEFSSMKKNKGNMLPKEDFCINPFLEEQEEQEEQEQGRDSLPEHIGLLVSNDSLSINNEKNKTECSPLKIELSVREDSKVNVEFTPLSQQEKETIATFLEPEELDIDLQLANWREKYASAPAPAPADHYLKRFHVYFGLKAYTHALAAIEEAILLDRTNPEVYAWHSQVAYLLGQESNQEGQVMKAIACYQKALIHDKGHWQCYNNLGEALIKTRQIDEALTAFNQGLAIKSTVQGWFNKGNLLCLKGEYVKNTEQALEFFHAAQQAYERALEIDDTYVPCYEALGQVLKRLDKSESALAFILADIQRRQGGQKEDKEPKRDGKAIQRKKVSTLFKEGYLDVECYLQHVPITETSLRLTGKKVDNKGMELLLEALALRPACTSLYLLETSLNNQAIAQLAKILEKDDRLTNLNLDGNFLKNEDVLALATALKSNKTLRKLSIMCPLSDHAADLIADALDVNPALQEVFLPNSIDQHIRDRIGKSLYRNLQKLKEKKEESTVGRLYRLPARIPDVQPTKKQPDETKTALVNSMVDYLPMESWPGHYDSAELDSNNRPATGVADSGDEIELALLGHKGGENKVLSFLERKGLPETATHLDYSDHFLDNAAAKQLAYLLRENKTVTRLNVSDNAINIQGFQAIVAMLFTNRTLTDLDIGGNLISGRESIEALSKALDSNDTLLRVRVSAEMSRTKIFLLEVRPSLKLNLASIGQKPREPVPLNLKSQGIDDVTIRALTRKLATIWRANALDLSDNAFGNDGVKTLAKYMEHTSTIQKLDLTGNAFSDEGIRALAAMLAKNSTLQELSLGGGAGNTVDISDEAAFILMQALQSNTNLKKLFLPKSLSGVIKDDRVVWDRFEAQEIKRKAEKNSNVQELIQALKAESRPEIKKPAYSQIPGDCNCDIAIPECLISTDISIDKPLPNRTYGASNQLLIDIPRSNNRSDANGYSLGLLLGGKLFTEELIQQSSEFQVAMREFIDVRNEEKSATHERNKKKELVSLQEFINIQMTEGEYLFSTLNQELTLPLVIELFEFHTQKMIYGAEILRDYAEEKCPSKMPTIAVKAKTTILNIEKLTGKSPEKDELRFTYLAENFYLFQEHEKTGNVTQFELFPHAIDKSPTRIKMEFRISADKHKLLPKIYTNNALLVSKMFESYCKKRYFNLCKKPIDKIDQKRLPRKFVFFKPKEYKQLPDDNKFKYLLFQVYKTGYLYKFCTFVGRDGTSSFLEEMAKISQDVNSIDRLLTAKKILQEIEQLEYACTLLAEKMSNTSSLIGRSMYDVVVDIETLKELGYKEEYEFFIIEQKVELYFRKIKEEIRQYQTDIEKLTLEELSQNYFRICSWHQQMNDISGELDKIEESQKREIEEIRMGVRKNMQPV